MRSSSTDAAGNVGTGSDTESYTVDVTAPAPTVTLIEHHCGRHRQRGGGRGQVAITGTVGGDAPVGDTVTLTVNGVSYTGTVRRATASRSTWRARIWRRRGLHDPGGVTSADAAGNVGTGSATASYTVDVTAPAPTVTLEAITADDIDQRGGGRGQVAITGTVGGECRWATRSP